LLCLQLSAQDEITVSNVTEWNAAFSKVQEKSLIITLLNDINLSSSEYTHYSDNNTMTVKCNGHTITVGGDFTWIGHETLTIDGDAIITETLKMKESSLNVNGNLTTKNLVITSGEQTTINVGPNGLLRVIEKITAPDAPNINVSKGGAIDVLGDADFHRVKLNLEEGGIMAVAGDLSVEQGYSVINGQLAVGGNMNIYWNNNNPNEENIVGNGTITVYSDYYCHYNNETNGSPCMQQLASYNHFNANNIKKVSGSYVNPLPIVLSKLTAKSNPNSTTIYWTTESETNNDYFTIYRSDDGETYEPIGTINGAGDSEQTINYSFTDYYPTENVQYYKLKQTDYDGKSETSKAIAVKRNAKAEACDVKVFPNPYQNNGMTIDLGSIASDIHIVIMTLNGSIAEKFEIAETTKIVRINPQLAAGAYVINIIADGITYCDKFIVK